MTPRAADRMHDKERERERVGSRTAYTFPRRMGLSLGSEGRGRARERGGGFLTHTMQKERERKRKKKGGRGKWNYEVPFSLSDHSFFRLFLSFLFHRKDISPPREKRIKEKREGTIKKTRKCPHCA